MNTGRSVVGRHDGSKELFCLGDGTRSRVWYLYVLLPDASIFFVHALLGCKACSLVLLSMPRRLTVFERLPQADAERVFLVGELVDKVSSITPEREFGV